MQALSASMTVYGEVLRAQLNKYKGVEMQADGDAILLGFRDPVSAVAWALATQQVCKPTMLLMPDVLQFRLLRHRQLALYNTRHISSNVCMTF